MWNLLREFEKFENIPRDPRDYLPRESKISGRTFLVRTAQAQTLQPAPLPLSKNTLYVT